MRDQLLDRLTVLLDERAKIDDNYDSGKFLSDINMAMKMRESDLEYFVGRVDEKVRRMRRLRVAL